MEEVKQQSGPCLDPLWDNTMVFEPSCGHTLHALCMQEVDKNSRTREQQNRCPSCRGWMWGYWKEVVPVVQKDTSSRE